MRAIFTLLVIGIFLSCSGCVQPVSTSANVLSQRVENDSKEPGFGTLRTESSVGGIEESGNQYSRLVQKYSGLYGMDGTLVMAVMREESRFHHDAVSYSGAYGLMQLMPMTQIELTERLGVDEARTPKNNIRAGVFHLKRLYQAFQECSGKDRICMTLAAYNAGLGRVQDAQKIASYLGHNPHEWNSVSDAMRFLTKQNYTLHKQVWPDGHPQFGYFRNWKQTTSYVGHVYGHYEEYLALR